MKLTLEDFQSHQSTELDIRGHLAVVVGPTNVGKSSVVKAARWVLYDSLRGSRFIRKGAKVAAAQLSIGDRTVRRVKSTSRNAYEVDGKPLEAIKSGAPVEVVEATGVFPVNVDKDLEIEVNVVSQAENPFLVGGDFANSAKAKVLNALTGFNVLDIALRETATSVKRVKDGEKPLTDSVERLEGQIAALGDVDGRASSVTAARTLHREHLMPKITRIHRMRELRDAYARVRDVFVSLFGRQFPSVAKLDSLVDKAAVAHTGSWRMHSLNANYHNVVGGLGVLRARSYPNPLQLQSTLDGCARKSGQVATLRGLVRARMAVGHLAIRRFAPSAYEALSLRVEAGMDRARRLKGLRQTVQWIAQEKTNIEGCKFRLHREQDAVTALAGSACPTCGQALREVVL